LVQPKEFSPFHQILPPLLCLAFTLREIECFDVVVVVAAVAVVVIVGDKFA
jgi:hypothetical protein